MSIVALTIEGMSCQHCVRAVQAALDAVNGVTGAQVEIGSAQVSFDPALVSAAGITDAVRESGYESEAQAVDA